MYRDTPTNNLEDLLIFEKSTGETATLFLEYNLKEQDIEDFLNGKEIIDLGDKITVKFGNGDVYLGNSIYRGPDGNCFTPVWQDPGGNVPKDPDGYWRSPVDCPQGKPDLSVGPNGGGISVYVYDFPFIPGSGNGGIGPVIDPDGPGGTYLNNPVYITPVSILSGVFQDFYNELDNNDQQMELLSNPDLRNQIRKIVTVIEPYQEEAFALAERIIDLSRAGYEEEALKLAEYASIADRGNVNSILDYLEQNNYSETVMQNISDLLDLAIDNDMTFEFDDTIDPAECLNFSNISEVENYFNNLVVDIENVEYTDEAVQQNQKTSTAKMKIGICDLEIDIQQQMSPYQILSVSGGFVGLSIGNGFNVVSFEVIGSAGNVAIVRVKGHHKIGITTDSVDFSYTKVRIFEFHINKTTGKIFGTLIIQ